MTSNNTASTSLASTSGGTSQLLTNAIVRDTMKKMNGSTIQDIFKALTAKNAELAKFDALAVYNSARYVSKRLATMKRNRASAQSEQRLQEFSGRTFYEEKLTPSIPQKRKLMEMLKESKTETKILKLQITSRHEQLEELEVRYKTLVSKMEGMNTEMKNNIDEGRKQNNINIQFVDKTKQMQSKLECVIQELDTVSVKYAEQQRKRLYESRKRKRRDKTILKLKSEVKEKRERNEYIRELQNNLTLSKQEKAGVSKKLETVKKQKRNLQQSFSRIISKSDQHQQVRNELEKTIDGHLEEIDNLRGKISDIESVNALLDGSSSIIQTFENGKYNNELRQTVMSLITEGGVSLRKVNKVITTVCKNLLGKVPSHLPSLGVKSRLLVEANAVANHQVMEALLADSRNADNPNKSGSVLHYDATTKYHKHYQSFQITTSKGITMSSGMIMVGSADTDALYEAFNSNIDDLADTMFPTSTESSIDKETAVAKIISAIKATMSDLGPVNPKFNNMLKQLRTSILNKAVDNWSELSENTQSKLKDMGNYFCKLHLLVNWASEADKMLLQFETLATEGGKNPFSHDMECGAVRLIYCCSKAFASRGCDKSGVYQQWVPFLEEKGLKNKIITFKGNRFNVLFHDAACVMFHYHDIEAFLDVYGTENPVLQSILFDCKVTLYKAGVLALGIVDKIITGPFWRLLESVGSILELNPHLKLLKDKLEEWVEDASPLLDRQCSLFPDNIAPILKDEVYDALFQEHNEQVINYASMALSLLCSGFLIILERQAKDQLPGGKYADLTPESLPASKNIPKTNKVSERDFAMLDMLVREKPGASTVALESVIMWINNKTTDWLEKISDVEKENILNQARKSAPAMMEKFKLKNEQVKEKRRIKLALKLTKQSEKKEKLSVSKSRITDDLNKHGGIWQEHEITLKVQHIMENEGKNGALDALWTQIQFHHKVLGFKKGPAYLLQKSQKGKKFSIEKMTDNLKMINRLTTTQTVPTPPSTQFSAKPPEEISTEVTELKKSITQKLIEQRNKIIIDQQRTYLPQFLQNPELLIGKKIKRKCRDPQTGEIEWFPACVISIKHATSNSLLTEYWIKYNDYDEKWYTPLLKDLKNKDLIVVDTN